MDQSKLTDCSPHKQMDLLHPTTQLGPELNISLSSGCNLESNYNEDLSPDHNTGRGSGRDSLPVRSESTFPRRRCRLPSIQPFLCCPSEPGVFPDGHCERNKTN